MYKNSKLFLPLNEVLLTHLPLKVCVSIYFFILSFTGCRPISYNSKRNQKNYNEIMSHT